MNTKIIGTGSYLPPTVMTNEAISKLVDTNDAWIRERTGIGKRHIATDDTTVSMASKAAQKALEAANITAEELDLVIVGTISADHLLPSTACSVQSEIGAKNAVAFDVNAACSGFLFAMNTANAYIKSGMYQNALIIGVETLSKITDWTDRSTCVLFADGAGAAVLTATDTEDEGILSFVQGSDGTRGPALYCKSRSNNNPYVTTTLDPGYITMDGPAVFKFAIKTVPACIRELLDKGGYTTQDPDVYVLHQANLRIIQSISKRLSIPMEKFPLNMEECGNTSAASVPILLDETVRSGGIKKGDLVILAGFGAGLTWGGALIRF
ncbi:MAG: ketoacyl-ACP synthase III [Eubacterium sp.]|nr:ketoacyl-ACP synthase III [Eubacterium sp.]